jgi:hypothetical protein
LWRQFDGETDPAGIEIELSAEGEKGELGWIWWNIPLRLKLQEAARVEDRTWENESWIPSSFCIWESANT